MERFAQEVLDRLRVFSGKVLEFIPDFLVMIFVIIIGLLVAWSARFVLLRAFRAVRFDKWSDEVGITSVFNKAGISSPPARVISLFVYWVLLLTFVMAGFGSLGLKLTDTLSSLFFLYLPRFISAIVIIIIGFIFAGFLSRAVLLGAVNAGVEKARLISEGVRVFLLIFVFAMALEQLAIAPGIVRAAFSIAFGAVALAFAIAFGLGGRDAAKKVIEEAREKKEKDNIEQL